MILERLIMDTEILAFFEKLYLCSTLRLLTKLRSTDIAFQDTPVWIRFPLGSHFTDISLETVNKRAVHRLDARTFVASKFGLRHSTSK